MRRTPSRPRAITTETGNVLKTTVVFDSYWHFAAERQEIFLRRLAGMRPPWTDDPILSTYRFTNPYRASDRVSQYLIRNVLYHGDQSPEEVFFRAVLFRLFNKPETWEHLESGIGPLTWRDFDYGTYEGVLYSAVASGQVIYSSAYIIPSPAFGSHLKHRNHLRLIQTMMIEDVPFKLQSAKSLSDWFIFLFAICFFFISSIRRGGRALSKV